MNTLPSNTPHHENMPANTLANASNILMAIVEGLGFALLSLTLYAIPMAAAYFLFHAITG